MVPKFQVDMRGKMISFWLYKDNNKLRDWKNVFTLHIPPLSSTHTYDFFVLTSLAHPRRILLVVLQIGKAKNSSAPLIIAYFSCSHPLLKSLKINYVAVKAASYISESRISTIIQKSKLHGPSVKPWFLTSSVQSLRVPTNPSTRRMGSFWHNNVLPTPAVVTSTAPMPVSTHPLGRECGHQHSVGTQHLWHQLRTIETRHSRTLMPH
jgi:hypothetical protein